MSIYWKQLRTKFIILAENKETALIAMKQLPGKERWKDEFPDVHFEGISCTKREDKWHYRFEDVLSLEEALLEWGWKTQLDADGNIIGLVTQSINQGDDDILFEAITPWVETGSEIQIINEKGGYFAYRFDDGKMKIVSLAYDESGFSAVVDDFCGEMVEYYQPLGEDSVTNENDDKVYVVDAVIDGRLLYSYSDGEIDDQQTVKVDGGVVVVAFQDNHYQFYYCPWDPDIEAHLPVYFIGSYEATSPSRM